MVVDIKGGDEVVWLGELLRSMNLNQYSQSAAQPGLAVDVIANLEIPVPPLHEQHVIADYLDCETAQLDALVAAKERLLELLVEKRRVLITRAVTRGIDGAMLWSATAKRSGDGAFTGNDVTDTVGAPRPAKAASQPPHSKKFRDSGLPWLGEIPAHWHVRRLIANFR